MKGIARDEVGCSYATTRPWAKTRGSAVRSILPNGSNPFAVRKKCTILRNQSSFMLARVSRSTNYHRIAILTLAAMLAALNQGTDVRCSRKSVCQQNTKLQQLPQRDWFSGKILRCHPSNVGEPWVRFPDHAFLLLAGRYGCPLPCLFPFCVLVDDFLYAKYLEGNYATLALMDMRILLLCSLATFTKFGTILPRDEVRG